MAYAGPRCGICGRPLLVFASEQDCQLDRDWSRWCCRCDGNGDLPANLSREVTS
jgi:hypothetical protein